MIASKRFALVYLFIHVVVFSAWLYIFQDDEWLRMVGSAILPIIGGALSFYWLIGAYKGITNKQRYVWLLLSIGVLLFTISNLFWFISLLTTGVGPYPDIASMTWQLTFILFLAALIYFIQILNVYKTISHLIFNVFVFMTIAISVSFQYLGDTVISLSGESFSVSISNIVYPITMLCISLVVIALFYLSKMSKSRKIVLVVIAAFTVQIVADTFFVIQTLNDNYHLASFIDVFWLMTILILGLAGLYAKRVQNEQELINKKPLKPKEAYFAYVCVIFLLFLTMNNHEWNFSPLSFGLYLIFFSIIIRQVFVIKKNEHFMSEFMFLAYHDSLTGLKNRTSLNEDIDEMIKVAKLENKTVALLLFDLDRFKTINDTYGHHTGDHLLIEYAQRLRDSIQDKDRIYRLGGDEFVIVLEDTSVSGAAVVAIRVLQEFSKPFAINNKDITITPSIGISIYPDHGVDSNELLKNADAAMYLAKEKGKNTFQFYNAILNEQLARRLELENGLRKAIQNDEFELLYQPKVHLESGNLFGLEALLRWENPELGRVSPVEFIPVLEEIGEIVSVGEWVLRTACYQNKKWQEEGLDPIPVSVNVSVRQFQEGDFVDTVKAVLTETGLDPEYLELEITESIMQNVKQSKKVLTGLRELGVKTSIDDFGTGYSSLFILKELPIDTIKIDKAFIDDIEEATNQSMVKAIIDIGLNLQLNVVAEGIEHQHQVEALLQYNCTLGQGYLFSKPISAYEIPRLWTSSDIKLKV